MTTPSLAPPRRSARVERFQVLVIGAGQAGLAVGHHLARQELDFAIVTADDRVGDGWRRRWDSLRLFTPARHSALPGLPFPAPPDHLPDKDEVAEYLERYAERFDLPVRTGTRVQRLSRAGGRFVVETDGSRLEADSVIVATGAFQRPALPPFAAALAPHIVQLHSSGYRNPLTLPDGPALVVGAANSGAQIALELARVRPVWLAGRDPGYLPRRLLGRDLFDWLRPALHHLDLDGRIGHHVRRRMRGGDARIGIRERDLLAAGVDRVPRIESVRDGLPVAGDRALSPSAVVWCTGFAPDFGWIALPVTDARGFPNHRAGVAEGIDGLYFLGLRLQRRIASSLVGGAGADAAFIAGKVAQRATMLA